MYKKVDPSISMSNIKKNILEFWEKNNIVDKKQKTYPEKLDELIDLGYINHIENIDDFEYKPYKKDNYYIYYELKIKKPLSNSYYISEGSKRSEYIAKED